MACLSAMNTKLATKLGNFFVEQNDAVPDWFTKPANLSIPERREGRGEKRQ